MESFAERCPSFGPANARGARDRDDPSAKASRGMLTQLQDTNFKQTAMNIGDESLVSNEFWTRMDDRLVYARVPTPRRPFRSRGPFALRARMT